MILVEGYMDVIGVYAAVLKSGGRSGTAFHAEQVRMVKRQVAQSGNAGK